MTEAPKGKKFIVQLSSAEQLDRLLVIVRMPGWIALLSLLVLTFLILLWACFGRITVTSSAMGIFFNPEAIELVQSNLRGVIAEIPFKPGDIVKEGDILIVLKDPEKIIELQEAQEQIKLLEERLSQEKKNANEKTSIELAKNRAIYELQKKRLQELQAKPGVEQVLYTLQVEMKNQEAAILILEQKLTHPDGILIQYDGKVEELQEKLALLKRRVAGLSVRAPANGRILFIEVVPGEEVDFGKNILWFEKEEMAETHSLIYSFFPLEKSGPIEPGMKALIQFNSVDANVYGKMLGSVKSVYPFSTSSQGGILHALPSSELRSYLTQGRASVAVVIEPKVDRNTASGFAWTTNLGPPTRPTIGSITTVEVITEAKRPITYIIPIKSN